MHQFSLKSPCWCFINLVFMHLVNFTCYTAIDCIVDEEEARNLGWIMSSHPVTSHMMTSSNGNIFRVTGPLCGEFTGPGEFPTQRPVTRSFDVFFDLRLNKRLSKQPWGWWFETLSWSLWRHRNDILNAVELRCWMLYFTNLCNQ